MIRTRTRRVIQGSDYSAQEPRLLSQLCGDEGMLKAYRDGKDLYVEIAAISFGYTYKECLEHFPKGCPIKLLTETDEDGNQHEYWGYAPLKNGHPDGKDRFEDLDYSNINLTDYDFDETDTAHYRIADGKDATYSKGKKRRKQAKSILLGIMYGRGARSIAEQLFSQPKTKEEQEEQLKKAQDIKDRVYKAFPKIKEYEERCTQNVIKNGYVATLWGRIRRLPEYNLPKYEFYYIKQKDNEDAPDVPNKSLTVPLSDCERYAAKLDKAFWKDRANIIKELKAREGVMVIDNGSKIAEAGRQIINSTVQGSAADMSKLALIKLLRDKALRKLGMKIIIPVHDEILVESPIRWSRVIGERFTFDMETAAKPKLTIPIYCDVETSVRWGEEDSERIDIEQELKGIYDNVEINDKGELEFYEQN